MIQTSVISFLRDHYWKWPTYLSVRCHTDFVSQDVVWPKYWTLHVVQYYVTQVEVIERNHYSSLFVNYYSN